MIQPILYEIRLLGLLLFFSGIIGYIFNALIPALVVGATLYLLRNLYQLLFLFHYVVTRKRTPSLTPIGFWEPIYDELERLHSRSRKRKRTLHRFTSRFREVSSVIPDALVLLNAAEEVEWANPAARHLLGISWPRDVGAALTKLVHYPDLDEYLANADYSQPLEFPSPTNKTVVLSMRITPFGGKKRQRLIVARDITKVFHLNLIRRDFVSNVSHELRTPLTVITGFLENLSDHELLPFQERPFELMNQQAARMNIIISDLLTLSRLEMENRITQQAPVAVPELLSKIFEQAKALANQKGGYQLVFDVDENLWLVGTENELQSTLSNLVFNAIVHTPPKTKITISWKRDADNNACFSVTDTGPGIPQRHIPRLTERFYRVDKARSRQSGGTGLGLAIVKHSINRHEGNLSITSKEGFGSCFSCCFPDDMTLDASQLNPAIKEITPII